jgi:hypothetical protein
LHHLVAPSAGLLWLNGAHDPKLGWYPVQYLADAFANQVKGTSTAGASLTFDVAAMLLAAFGN